MIRFGCFLMKLETGLFRHGMEVDPKFAFDVNTGIATYSDHQIFTLDVANGRLQLTPQESLSDVIPMSSDVYSGRATLDFTCRIPVPAVLVQVSLVSLHR